MSFWGGGCTKYFSNMVKLDMRDSSEHLDLQAKRKAVRKYNYCSDELNKVIKAGRRCREENCGTFDESAVKPQVG